MGQNLLYVFLHRYHGELLNCTVLLFKNYPRRLLIFLLFFNQVVMTIIVAFILEAFLFRIQYRREHRTDERGTFLTVTVWYFFGKSPIGLIYAKGVYLGVRTCELFLWFAARFECVDFFVFFANGTSFTGSCTKDELWNNNNNNNDDNNNRSLFHKINKIATKLLM